MAFEREEQHGDHEGTGEEFDEQSVGNESARPRKTSPPPGKYQEDDDQGHRKQSKDARTVENRERPIESGDESCGDRKWGRQTEAEQEFRVGRGGRFRFPNHQHQSDRRHKEKEADEDFENQIAARPHAARSRGISSIRGVLVHAEQYE